MRLIAALALTMCVAPADGQPPFRQTDLDAPGVLAAIERNRPDHFAKIQRILAEAPWRPTGDSVAKWMRTEFQAKDVRYSYLLMTSYPAKTRLEFSLDDASYVTVIRVEGTETLMPLKRLPSK